MVAVQPKKRILLSNEASYLSTGFSTYGLEVMKRLHATGKYELAEYATYGDTSDPNDRRWEEIPWGFYPVKPNMHNPSQCEQYNSKVTNQFGEWRFEEVCCDFQADVIFGIRDWWMDEFLERSPFRPYYHLAIMPTVDSYPMDDAWLATYMSADGVFAYSDWGLNVLVEQGRGRVKTICSAPPGADIETLRPVADKRQHKKQMNLPEDSLVVGTIMRNQMRKLYPELIAGFARYLREAPAELARRTYLYLHCCYPDVGWDIPRLVKEAGLGARTIFTYFCQKCGVAYPTFYMDAKAYCRSCHAHEATLPGSNQGVARSVLANIINFFDVYVQYANSEGFGLPMVEAAACGVPVMAVDYSAMSDVVRKLKGYPIKVLALRRECETGCFRAVPDEDDLVAKLVSFLSLPDSVRAKKGFDTRKAVERHYTYDRTAKIWEDYFDGLVLPDRATTWHSPARFHQPATNVAANLTDEQFVRWGITHIVGRPDLANSYAALRMMRDLAWGMSLFNTPKSIFNELALLGVKYLPSAYNREIAIKEMLEMCHKRNFWEGQRTAAPRKG